METRSIHQLTPHPENVRIYGDGADTDLVASIREKGILVPLLITHENTVISGHRRLDAARKNGLAEVPVMVFGSSDEKDILEALVHANKQRHKTNEQFAQEARIILQVEQARAEERKSAVSEVTNEIRWHGVSEVENLPPQTEFGKARDIAAESLNVSGKHLEKAVNVLNAIDTLRESGKEREATMLRNTLNQRSVHRAYEQARESGYIAPSPNGKKPEPKMAEHITLAEWNQMSAEQQEQALFSRHGESRFNWQDSNNIEWALWSWNPVTGCKHNCPYCYARDIANRFYPQKFEPAILPDRLLAPGNTPLEQWRLNKYGTGARNVFTCSMADLFGRWVPESWIHAVLDVIRESPQWNFLFLTKFPARLAEFDFPDNAWVGTTVDCQARVENAEKAFRRVNAKVKWLSCEPLLEPLQFSDLSMFQWIVLGGASASSETPMWRPPRQWINDIEAKAAAAGCMIYEKTNLLDRIQQYPGQENIKPSVLPDELRYLATIG